MAQNQIPSEAFRAKLREKRCRVGDSIVEIAYHPTFADWLHWLESDELLLMKEAGTPQNVAWAKNLLARWREAGRPCPSEWPETQNHTLDWLRPSHSSWPDCDNLGKTKQWVKYIIALIRDHIRLAFLFSAPLDSAISLSFIDSGKASDLPSPDKIKKTIDVLKGDIRRRLPACKHDIGKSKRAVEVCYATLLIEDTEPEGIRFEFDEPNYENIFGDMYFVQTAIYLGAKIMTKDRKLDQMASYAGIKCFHVPSLIKQRQPKIHR